MRNVLEVDCPLITYSPQLGLNCWLEVSMCSLLLLQQANNDTDLMERTKLFRDGELR